MGRRRQSGQPINRVATDTRHRAHGFVAIFSRHDKDGPNQINRAEMCFAHHRPQCRIGPQPPRTQGRKGGLGLKTRHDWNLIYIDSLGFLLIGLGVAEKKCKFQIQVTLNEPH